MQAYRSSTWRSVTFSERMPPPTGVVSGPLIETRNSSNASTVSCGSQSPVFACAFSPANTSIHAIFRSPPYAFSTAASNTRTDARQMSGPVPSPSMNGMIGLSGIFEGVLLERDRLALGRARREAVAGHSNLRVCVGCAEPAKATRRV